MFELIFITGNIKKIQQAQKALKGYPIRLKQRKLNVSEIQAKDCQKIAEFAAQYAANKIRKPVVTTDAGYYIKALNGFPGSFIKFINQWLTPNDILQLMSVKKNRTVYSPLCVAYCEPNNKPISFVSDNWGSVARKPEGSGSTIDQLYIPKGYDRPIATLSEDERLSVWNMDCWVKLAQYLIEQKLPKE